MMSNFKTISHVLNIISNFLKSCGELLCGINCFITKNTIVMRMLSFMFCSFMNLSSTLVSWRLLSRPGVRQRRKNQELKERIAAMKRRSRDAEWWKASKRSLLKPLTITIGLVFFGAIYYWYSKH